MTPADAALLQTLPELGFQALLLFCRLGAAVMLLPGLGEQEIPTPIRLGLGLALLALLLPLLLPGMPAAPQQPAEVLRLVAQEVAIGLWLGGLARVAVLALFMAGQVITMLIGLSGLLVGDVVLGAQATALGRAFGLLAAALVLSSGLHGLALEALVRSYALLPAGAPFPTGPTAESLAVTGAISLELALRLAAPFVIAAVVLNVALGLLARLAPQVQTFFVTVPGQILAGLALLMLLAPPMLASFAAAMRATLPQLPAGG